MSGVGLSPLSTVQSHIEIVCGVSVQLLTHFIYSICMQQSPLLNVTRNMASGDISIHCTPPTCGVKIVLIGSPTYLLIQVNLCSIPVLASHTIIIESAPISAVASHLRSTLAQIAEMALLYGISDDIFMKVTHMSLK